jgi:hypothetical protein
VAAEALEHVWEQLPLQLSDVIASFEELAAADLEHVWEQLPLQLSEIAASLEKLMAVGGAEQVLQQPPLKFLSRAHATISHPS